MIPIKFKSIIDSRGELVTTDGLIPFDVKNVFWIYGNRFPRGGHAHKRTEQVLIAIQGEIEIKVDLSEFMLGSPAFGLYVPTKKKVTMTFGRDAILLVLASERYDPDDYIQ